MNAGTVMHSVEQSFMSYFDMLIPTTAQHGLLGVGLVVVSTMMAVATVVYWIVGRRKKISTPLHYERVDSANNKMPSRGASCNNNNSAGPQNNNSNQQQPLPENSASSGTTVSSAADCAWEQRRRRGIAAHSLHEKKDAGNEKPFGSSYYYAHNNTRATGGYKDGLTMEDFTMNGPRLLSRGGKPVGSDDDDGSSRMARDDDCRDDRENDISKTESMGRNDKKQNASTTSLKRSIPISRYLWDDPGDAKKGIATLRIEELPGKRSTDPMIPWKDVAITKINAALVNSDEGLLVTIETDTDVDYELRIPKLYGKLEDVEALAKPKRLLLRLKKKASLLNKSNLQAWPHPQKKIS